MLKLTNKDLKALFVQWQQHPNAEDVHISRGLFGRLSFHFKEPEVHAPEPKKHK